MALAERLNSRTAPATGRPCSVGALLEALDGDERAALLHMLGTPEQRGWSEGEIYDALIAEGYTVGRQSINRHRGGRCRCNQGRVLCAQYDGHATDCTLPVGHTGSHSWATA